MSPGPEIARTRSCLAPSKPGAEPPPRSAERAARFGCEAMPPPLLGQPVKDGRGTASTPKERVQPAAHPRMDGSSGTCTIVSGPQQLEVERGFDADASRATPEDNF